MTEATAKRLYGAARRLGFTGSDCDRDERVTMQKDYSGRGMYGRTTFALCVPHVGFVAMMAAAARVKRHDREEFALEMKGLGSDSMGMGIVVY
jgi:hypothetical protein